jgi:hypothetical protein
MSRLDKTSEYVAPIELSMYDVLPTDPTFQSMDDTPHRPNSIIDAGGAITFEIVANAEEMIKPSHFYLTFGVRILTHDGKPITKAHNVGPVNNFGHSVWSSIVVEWGGQPVSACIDYAIRAYITALFSYGVDATKSHQSCSLFEKDTAGHMDDVPGATNQNAGLKERTEYLSEGKIAYFRVKLDCEALNTEKLLHTMVSVRVTLHRANPAQCLMAGKQTVAAENGNAERQVDPDFKIDIINPVLWVTKVKLLPSVLSGQNKAIELDDAKYKVTRVVVRNTTIAKGVTSHSWDNVFSGQMPKRIIFGFVRNEAFTGNYSLNPLNFQHCNVVQICVYINGKSYPSTPFQPNYASGDYIRVYGGIFDAMGIRYGNRGIDIHRKDFPNGYCLYAVDLTSNRGASDSSHINLIKQGSLRIDVQFGVNLAYVMSCIAYAEFDNLIKVDKDRNVSTNYSSAK